MKINDRLHTTALVPLFFCRLKGICLKKASYTSRGRRVKLSRLAMSPMFDDIIMHRMIMLVGGRLCLCDKLAIENERSERGIERIE